MTSNQNSTRKSVENAPSASTILKKINLKLDTLFKDSNISSPQKNATKKTTGQKPSKKSSSLGKPQAKQPKPTAKTSERNSLASPINFKTLMAPNNKLFENTEGLKQLSKTSTDGVKESTEKETQKLLEMVSNTLGKRTTVPEAPKSNAASVEMSSLSKNTNSLLTGGEKLFVASPETSTITPKPDPPKPDSANSKMKPYAQDQLLNTMRHEVLRAMKENKTFTVNGLYTCIRKALQRRGWVEKINPLTCRNDEIASLYKKTLDELTRMLTRENNETICAVIKSKLLDGHHIDLCWCPNNNVIKVFPGENKITTINIIKFNSISFTSKRALSDAAKNKRWVNHPYGVFKFNHPRTYTISKSGSNKDFLKDFHITAAISLLIWVLKTDASKESKILSPTGKIPLKTFDFAVAETEKYIAKAKGDDSDPNEPLDEDWEVFLDSYYRTVHVGNHFLFDGKDREAEMVLKSKTIIRELRVYYPHIDVDGVMNIWILKPSGGTRGQGIHMCRTMQYIMNIVNENNTRIYVIQKYIDFTSVLLSYVQFDFNRKFWNDHLRPVLATERPLLIYNTKFDIRQWFLISQISPLTIWMYKEYYLRFSSQTYNIRKLHESIHITNNAVQSRYKNGTRDLVLPAYNMWNSIQFHEHLSNIGYPNAFHDIYNGMCEAIVGAVLRFYHNIDNRKNSFQLFGADFMVSDDFTPWLIEINAQPTMHLSTPITTKMCPEVQEDLIKVVVDYPQNNRIKTGKFEIIYQEKKWYPHAEKAKMGMSDICLKRTFQCKSELSGTVPCDSVQSSLVSLFKSKIPHENLFISEFKKQFDISPKSSTVHISDNQKAMLEEALFMLQNAKKKTFVKHVLELMDGIIKGSNAFEPGTFTSQESSEKTVDIIIETKIKSQPEKHPPEKPKKVIPDVIIEHGKMEFNRLKEVDRPSSSNSRSIKVEELYKHRKNNADLYRRETVLTKIEESFIHGRKNQGEDQLVFNVINVAPKLNQKVNKILIDDRSEEDHSLPKENENEEKKKLQILKPPPVSKNQGKKPDQMSLIPDEKVTRNNLLNEIPEKQAPPLQNVIEAIEIESSDFTQKIIRNNKSYPKLETIIYVKQNTEEIHPSKINGEVPLSQILHKPKPHQDETLAQRELRKIVEAKIKNLNNTDETSILRNKYTPRTSEQHKGVMQMAQEIRLAEQTSNRSKLARLLFDRTYKVYDKPPEIIGIRTKRKIVEDLPPKLFREPVNKLVQRKTSETLAYIKKVVEAPRNSDKNSSILYEPSTSPSVESSKVTDLKHFLGSAIFETAAKDTSL